MSRQKREEQRDYELSERRNYEKLQKEYETLDRNYRALESQRKQELEASFSEYEKLQAEH